MKQLALRRYRDRRPWTFFPSSLHISCRPQLRGRSPTGAPGSDRNLLYGRPRLEVVDTALGGAAPRQPLFLLLGIASGNDPIVGSPGRVKRKAGENPGHVMGSEPLVKGRMRGGWRNTDRVADPRRGCAAGGRRPAGDYACGPQLRQRRLPGGCGRTQATAPRETGSSR